MNDKNIKILIISTTKFGLNGITNVILNYYNAIDKSDLQIDFVVINDVDRDLNTTIESKGSKVYKIGKRIKNPLIYVGKLIKLIRENGYDIVHAHGNSCTLALEMYAANKGGAKVRISHSHSSSCKFKLVHRLLRLVFDKNYTHAFSCSEIAGRWLYRDKPFTVIKNGIDIARFTYNENIRKEYRDDMNLTDKKVIGHIGSFVYTKNHSFLIEVFNELYRLNQDYRLLLIGDGEMKKDIEHRVRELGISDVVIFTGKRTDISQLMSTIDIFVLPSHFEGLPLTVVEAQAACLPCFLSDNITKEVAITSLVKFISLRESPKEWASIINNSIKLSRQDYKEKSCNQITSAGYSITENAKHLKELYKTYVKKN